METKSDNSANLPQMIADNLQKLTEVSISAMQPVIEGMIGNISALGKSVLAGDSPLMKIPVLKFQGDDCCAPKNTCPPHCILSISRNAQAGERIIVPFFIKNTCSHEKTFRIGVRELKDSDGNMAPAQPTLNKSLVTLQPAQSERVMMTIDLANFADGVTYATEIVLREKDINQNICFTLTTNGDKNLPVAAPLDEQKYHLRWQDWKSHFYCEPPVAKPQTHAVVTGENIHS